MESYVEWIEAFGRHIAFSLDRRRSLQVLQSAYCWWRTFAASVDDSGTLNVAAALRGFLSAGAENQGGRAGVRRAIRTVITAVAGSEIEARECSGFIRRFNVARRLHDLLVGFIGIAASAHARYVGPERASSMLWQALATCSFFSGFWNAALKATASERAVLLAEEFRGHFSGPQRHGSVRILTSENAYTLVLNPCGSGGALRRHLTKRSRCGFSEFPILAGAQWSAHHAVPAYCVHCVQNESYASLRCGHPLWRTMFEPTDSGSCSWHISRARERKSDPREVPAHDEGPGLSARLRPQAKSDS
jgi:hypothetical protein